MDYLDTDPSDEPPSRHTAPSTGSPARDTPAAPLPDVTAVVLAGGSGTRMRSRLPKVLQPLAGRPMLGHVLAAVSDAGLRQAVVVTGPQDDAVRAAVESAASGELEFGFVRQQLPLGTGHAVLLTAKAVKTGTVLVVNGDLGLVEAEQIRAVAVAEGDLVLATAVVADPTGYGRIARDAEDRFSAIVEEAEVTPEQAAIREMNVGIYRIPAGWLWPTLESIEPASSGELYLTDILARAVTESLDVRAIALPLPDGALNIENKRDLARAEVALRRRISNHWLDQGVTIVDPGNTYIDADVCIGADSVIEPGSHLRGRTIVGAECVIGPNTVIRDSQIGDRCELLNCQLSGAHLADDVEVGAYSTLREGTVLDSHVHVGTHAEIKQSQLHEGVQMGHFSYVGDAEVGARSNIGAGTITCNFDGARKHRTVIGQDVFIGSDSLLIAPLVIGDGASTGAGAVVTKDVPAGVNVVGAPARTVRPRSERGASS